LNLPFRKQAVLNLETGGLEPVIPETGVQDVAFYQNALYACFWNLIA
jgi:hypothetical protein